MFVSCQHRKQGPCSPVITKGKGLLLSGVLAVGFMTTPGVQADHNANISGQLILEKSAKQPSIWEEHELGKATPDWGWQQFQRRLHRIQKRQLQTMVVQYAGR